MKLIQSIAEETKNESKQHQPVLRLSEDQIKVLILDSILNPNDWDDEHPQFHVELLNNQSTNKVEVIIYQEP